MVDANPSHHDSPFSQDFNGLDGRPYHAEWQIEKQSWRITRADDGEWLGDWWKLKLPTTDAHAYPPSDQLDAGRLIDRD